MLRELIEGGGDHISYIVKTVKETLRRIPAKGINYGILKYLTKKENKDITAKEPQANGHIPPGETSHEGLEITFNYLGQFSIDSGNEPGIFEMSPISSGDAISPEMEQFSLIDINGFAAGDGLVMNITYNPLQLDSKNIERLATHYKTNLQKIIHHTMNRKEKEVTPSDLGTAAITIEEFDRVTRDIKRKLGKETEINRIYPLSPMQKGMLFHYIAGKKTGAYFEQTLFSITGELEVPQLKESFKQLTERYDIFRTVFIHEGLEEPLQMVLEPGKTGENPVRFLYEDITQIKGKDQKRAVLETMRQKDKEQGFELSGEMPVRITVIKTGAQSYHIIWSFFHIIMDGWCLGIVFKELLQIYHSIREGTPVQLEPVTPYEKYIRWLEGQDNEEGLEYWRKYLEGYEQIAVLPKVKPVERRHKLDEEYNQAHLVGEIETQKTAQLNKMAQQNGTTLNLVLQTIWGLLLMRYNNCEDVVFGAVVSGRPVEIEGIEEMVGLFINTVPVRVTADSRQGFQQQLRTLHRKNAKSNAYEYQSLAEIQANSSLKDSLIDHIMVFENYPVAEEVKQSTNEQDIPFKVNSMEVREQTNYSLNITIVPAESIKITYSYNTTVYNKIDVENIHHHFNEIINQVLKNPEIHRKDLQLVTEKEKEQLLFEFNDTDAQYPRDKTIHQLFEEQAKRTPDSISTVGSTQYAVGKEKIKDKKEIKDNKKTKEQLLQTGGSDHTLSTLSTQSTLST
ncbi:MAG: hypothetical protein GY757_32120, partial [bacterium]|nr:hypothetical protein [bacterium]